MTLQGIDSITLAPSAAIMFSHPAVDGGPLYIHSGANAIKWAYHLNTQTTPTIGGEVVQVLSATVGPMQISGQTMGLRTNRTGALNRNEVKGWQSFHPVNPTHKNNYSPNDELKSIVEWFQNYMEVAGSTTKGNQKRDERAIRFHYPARGWSFYLIVTSIDGFRYDQTVISPEWSITAEVISDNALNYFSGITMSSFNDDVITNQALIGKLGLSHFGQTGTERANPAFGQTGDAGSTDPFLNPELSASAGELARKMGDNFQSLVAAWSSGTFSDFGFGALLDNGALPKNVDSIYQSLFGSTFLGRLPGNTGSGTTTSGSTVYGPSDNPTTKDDIVLDIASQFESKGIPGKVGVATSLVETGGSLNPDDRQSGGDFAMGLFQTFPLGAGGSYHKAELTQAINNKQDPVTKYYPVGLQISDAASWFAKAKGSEDLSSATDSHLAAFAQRAQGAGDPDYISKILNQLGNAQAMITAAQNKAAINNTGPVPVGTTVSLAKHLLSYAGTRWRDDNGQGLSQIKKVAAGQNLTNVNGISVALDPRTLQVVLYLIGRGYTIGTFAWCEDHHDDGLGGHAGGHAVDISSINGVSINSPPAGQLTLAVATLLHNLTGVIAPRQLITGGFNNQPDAALRALTIPQMYYDETTLSQHENHIHVGY